MSWFSIYKDMGREIRIICVSLFLFIMIGILSLPDRAHPFVTENMVVDLLQQPDDITCGPTTVAMLLRYYEKYVPIAEISAVTNTVWYRGTEGDFGMTAPEYVAAGLRHYGLDAELRYGNLDNLKHFVAMGKPCIVLVRSAEWSWHYILVIGYDMEYMFYANPASGTIEGLSTAEFKRAWNWDADLSGRDCSGYVKFWLRALEIYPNSFVYVR